MQVADGERAQRADADGARRFPGPAVVVSSAELQCVFLRYRGATSGISNVDFRTSHLVKHLVMRQSPFHVVCLTELKLMELTFNRLDLPNDIYWRSSQIQCLEKGFKWLGVDRMMGEYIPKGGIDASMQ